MSWLDWTVLCGTIGFIITFGIIQSRNASGGMKGFLLGGNSSNWFAISLSIMATQASAITFLSVPGQAFTDGMRFAQFYFGLPLAMIIVSIFFVPKYMKLGVYTAYEYLEGRFDLKTRVLTASLFLMQRGLAAGFTIFAPSLVLSSILGWDIQLTNIAIGILVITYTVMGGSKAVAVTQKYQMAIIMGGMVMAGFIIVNQYPEQVSFLDALHIAGKAGKMEIVDFEFDPTSKYNIWTGLIGGFFLALSYFGTDQSQVQRYLSSKSADESKLGLLFNGAIKIPIQVGILLIGALLYVFYIFQPAPLNFNPVTEQKMAKSTQAGEYQQLYYNLEGNRKIKESLSVKWLSGEIDDNNLRQGLSEAQAQDKTIREKGKKLIASTLPSADPNDTNYIFFYYIKQYFPAGLLGLLIAVMLSASMSSTSSELNALASTSLVDIYQRLFNKNASEQHYVFISKALTVGWGIYAIIFAMFANRLGTLIEAVNILGSLVYGVILGVFLSALLLKKARGTDVFIGAGLAQIGILYCYFFTEIPYLWFNVIGCLPVVIIAGLLSLTKKEAV